MGFVNNFVMQIQVPMLAVTEVAMALLIAKREEKMVDRVFTFSIPRGDCSVIFGL